MSRVVLFFGFLLLFLPASLHAQDAVVTQNAPIYVLPDVRRQPLRTAAPSTRLRVVEEQGEWLRVEFQDPQFGKRVGYVESKYVQISRPELQPMDLSIREKAENAGGTLQPAVATQSMQPPGVQSSRQPQIQPHKAYRGYALGVGGVTFQSETSGLFGAEFGGDVARDLRVYGQVGHMINVLPNEIQDELDEAADALTFVTRARWQFDGKLPSTYFGGGVKYLVPTGGPVRPYVLGGVNGAHFKASVKEIDLGEMVDDLIEGGYLNEEDVKATRAGYEAGGGVSVGVGSIQIDAGYRFLSFPGTQINVSRFVFGFGGRF
jgi:opacity protein-like surface antigen